MSARDIFPITDDRSKHESGTPYLERKELNLMFNELDLLAAELVGLRVRTRTAEGDADRLAGTLAGIHQPRLSLHPRDCGCGTHLALEAHASAFARRVAGETGDTPQ